MTLVLPDSRITRHVPRNKTDQELFNFWRSIFLHGQSFYFKWNIEQLHILKYFFWDTWNFLYQQKMYVKCFLADDQLFFNRGEKTNKNMETHSLNNDNDGMMIMQFFCLIQFHELFLFVTSNNRGDYWAAEGDSQDILHQHRWQHHHQPLLRHGRSPPCHWRWEGSERRL